MRNIKMWAKLGLGFGAVILLMGICIFIAFISAQEADDVSSFAMGPEADALAVINAVNIDQNWLAYRMGQYRDSETEEAWANVDKAEKEEEAAIKKGLDLANGNPKLVTARKYMPLLKDGLAKYNAAITRNHDAIVEKKKVIESLAAARTAILNGIDELIHYITPSVEKDFAAGDTTSAQRGFNIITLTNEMLEHALTVRAEMSVIIYSKAYDEESKNKLFALIKEIKKPLDAIKAVSSRPETLAILNKIQTAYDAWEKSLTAFFDTTEKIKAAVTDCTSANGEYTALMEEAMKTIKERVAENNVAATEAIDNVERVLIIGFVVALLIGIIVAFFITRAITKPLSRVLTLAKRAEDGDLTITKAEFEYSGSDEIGHLVDALSSMIAEQAKATKSIINVAKRVGEEAQTLAATSQETNASMEEIRASVMEVNRLSESNGAALEQSNAGIEEMAAGAATVAQSSTDGAENVAVTGEVSEKAVEMVDEVIAEMNSVGKKSEANEAQIRKLAESVEQISGFVSVITSIADQTNLLALNAAIEAARAGEAGRGFAVVADEVRKLAEESGNAAKNVSQLISSLQSNAKFAIASTVESAEIVQKTLKRAGEAQSALNGAIKRIKSVNEVIQNIAAVAEEQAASSKEMASAIDTVTKGMNEVGERIQSVQDSTSGASIAAENVATTAQTLNELAEELSRVLAHFKVDSSAPATMAALPAKTKKK